MTIDTSRFELRVVQFDPENPKLGIWDKQKERFTGTYAFSLEAGKALLKQTIQNADLLVWKETGKNTKWREVQIFNCTTELWQVDARQNLKSLEDEQLALGKQVRILELIETQYVCENRIKC